MLNRAVAEQADVDERPRRRACLRTNATPTATPATSVAAVGHVTAAACAHLLAGWTSSSTAAIDCAAPVRSNPPAFSSRDSGRSTGPRISNSTMTGTLIRKTEPHQKASSSSPPTIGPAARPPVNAAVHTPTATRRWVSSRNIVRSSASVEGARVAPPTPSSARAAMSVSAVGE